jgi:hypothetical protein
MSFSPVKVTQMRELMNRVRIPRGSATDSAHDSATHSTAFSRVSRSEATQEFELIV